jgi:hypothetical protein
MKKEDYPALLFEQTSAVENKFNMVNCQIPKEDRIATVLEKAPKEYGTVLTVVAEIDRKQPGTRGFARCNVPAMETFVSR